MEEALIIVDIQNDYFEGGRNELVNTVNATLQTKKLIESFRKKDEPIIYIKHICVNPNADFFIEGTDGTNISELITPKSSDIIIEKHHPSSFLETTLQENLIKLGVKKLVICGMMTQMCIDTTVRAAKNLNYDVTVVEDACATKDLMWNNVSIPADIVQKVYMASLNSTFAKICKVQDLI